MRSIFFYLTYFTAKDLLHLKNKKYIQYFLHMFERTPKPYITVIKTEMSMHKPYRIRFFIISISFPGWYIYKTGKKQQYQHQFPILLRRRNGIKNDRNKNNCINTKFIPKIIIKKRSFLSSYYKYIIQNPHKWKYHQVICIIIIFRIHDSSVSKYHLNPLQYSFGCFYFSFHNKFSTRRNPAANIVIKTNFIRCFPLHVCESDIFSFCNMQCSFFMIHANNLPYNESLPAFVPKAEFFRPISLQYTAFAIH